MQIRTTRQLLKLPRDAYSLPPPQALLRMRETFANCPDRGNGLELLDEWRQPLRVFVVPSNVRSTYSSPNNLRLVEADDLFKDKMEHLHHLNDIKSCIELAGNDVSEVAKLLKSSNSPDSLSSSSLCMTQTMKEM